MASQWPPKKNTAFTLYFTLYKDDGTIIANPGTITKKVSIDGAAVADIAASVTEEDTTYGQCSLVIASGEMNGDAIWIYITDDTSGCVPFTCTLYTAANTQDGIEGKIDTIDGIVDDILEDTGTTIPGTITTIDGIVDDILEDTGTTIPGTISTMQGNVDDILTDTETTLDTLIKDIPTVAEFEARTLTTAAATKLSASAATIVQGTVSHDNTASSTTVFYSDDITEATADHYNGRIVIFTSGDLLYQATDITDYELVTGEGKFTVTALTEAPADNVTFVIV